MNDPEINSSNDLAGQVAALQRQVFALMLALIVVSGTVVAYLGYESHHLGNDAKAINDQVVQPYKQKLPAITNFVGQVVAFGQSHPDFHQQVLVKDGVVPATPPPAANTPSKPATPAPAAPKK